MTDNELSRRFPPWLVLMGVLTAIGPMSIDMYLPSFPAVEAALGPGAPLTLASFFVGLAIGQLIYGPVSDRIGRRPPIYFGLVLYIIASLMCAHATSMTMLIALRFVQALGGCAGMVICRAIVRDRCDARAAAQAFSMLMLVMGLAPILAPLFGGWILGVASWKAIFYTQVAFGVVCLVWVHVGLAESRDTRHAEPLELMRVLRTYASLARDAGFMGYTLTTVLASTGMFAYIAGSPKLLMEHYDIAPAHYGWVFGANAFGLISASQINARLLRRGRSITDLLRRMLWLPVGAGLLLGLAAWSGFAPIWLLLPCFFFYMASLGFINPNAGAAALATHGQRAGLASALMGALQFVLAASAGALMDAWIDGSARPLATLMAASGVAAWAAHYFLVTRRAASAA
ncbi:MAG: multidrug effflux MFS transporter [Rhodocyclaceae bacterium]